MNSRDLEQIWNQVCQKITTYPSVDVSIATAFFTRIHPMVMSEDFLMITADNDFIKSWVERNYLPVIIQALNEIFKTSFRVVIEVDLKEDEENTLINENPFVIQAKLNNQITPSTPIEVTEISNKSNMQFTQKENDTSFSSSNQIENKKDNSVSPNENLSTQTKNQDITNPILSLNDNSPINTFSFENFVIGDSNKMAYSMAIAVAEEPGKSHLNPLFIYGKSGIGKTHLLRAIQNYICSTLPSLHVVYADSAQFLNDYVNARIRSDKEKTSYINFKKQYEEADVLLIDDVQYLQGKTETLEILFQLFNSLTAQGKQVVFSADRAPKNIDLDERYLSRFNQGGTVDIQPPEIETKLSIIKALVDEFQQSESVPDFSIDQEILVFIAELSSSNIRELKGAVTRVIYQSFYTNQPITLEDTRKLLENHFSGGPSKRLTAEDIQREVENFYKVSHADLIGEKRTRNIMHARKVAIYLCRDLLDIPYNDIGRKFNRDHTTIIYTVTNMETKINESRDIREEIESLKNNLKNL